MPPGMMPPMMGMPGMGMPPGFPGMPGMPPLPGVVPGVSGSESYSGSEYSRSESPEPGAVAPHTSRPSRGAAPRRDTGHRTEGGQERSRAAVPSRRDARTKVKVHDGDL